jgi:hypothetical protein
MPGVNVNQITSTLAKLSSPQLQQYAQMHKSNPYILALAMSEATRRKELQAAGQAQGFNPQQPKVADAMIAQMSPEEQGIGALPTQNMQMMADGGIAGYDDQEPVQMLAGGGVAESNSRDLYRDGVDPLTGTFFMPEAPAAPPDQASMRKVAASPYTSGVPRTPEEAAMLQRFPAPGKAASAKQSPDLVQSSGGGGGGGGGAALPGTPGMDITGMYGRAMANARNIDNPFATDIEAVGKEKVKASEENLAGLEAIQKKFDDIFKGRKERMGTREEEVNKIKDEAGRMAMVSFGLAMAKTPGSGLKGLLSGLTAGAEAGSKQYVAGMDKFRAAQEKLNDAKDRLEEIEANRGEMSARELHKARNDIRATTISAREDMIKSNMDMYKLNREDAQKMFTAQVQYGIAQMEQGGANARAKLAASTQRLPAEANMAMMLGKGTTEADRLRSGLAEMAKFKGKDNTGGAELLKQFVELKKANPTLTTDEFLRDATNVMLPTYTAPPKNAVVRTQPGQ